MADGVDEHVRLRRLEQEPLHPGRKCPEHVLLRVEGREHEHRRRLIGLGCALLVRWHRSLWAGLALHMVNNLMASAGLIAVLLT